MTIIINISYVHNLDHFYSWISVIPHDFFLATQSYLKGGSHDSRKPFTGLGLSMIRTFDERHKTLLSVYMIL